MKLSGTVQSPTPSNYLKPKGAGRKSPTTIPRAGQAENMHSVLRRLQQKRVGDVMQTQEFTEHMSFAHIESKDERRLIRNFLSGGATTLKVSSRQKFLCHALKKSLENEGEVFMLLDLNLICFDQVWHSGLSLPPLEYFHNELKRVEQLLCYPLQTSIDPSELMTFRC